MVKKTIVNVLVLKDEQGRIQYLREDDNRMSFLGGLVEEVIRNVETDVLHYVRENVVERLCWRCKGYGECAGAHEDHWGPTCPSCRGFGIVDGYEYELVPILSHDLWWRLEEPYSWHESELAEF